MKYQQGDDIIVLLTKEEGKIVEVINDKMVLIEVRGVKFPAYTDQIDFPYFHRFTKNKLIEEKKKPAPKKYIDEVSKEKKSAYNAAVPSGKANEGVWLSLLPKFTLDDFNDEVVELFKIHIINKNNQAYYFNYKQQFFGRTEFEQKGELLAQKDFYLHDLSFADFNDNPSFNILFSLLSADKTKADEYETSLKLRPKQLFQHIEVMKTKNEPTILFKLFQNYPSKQAEDKPDIPESVSRQYKAYEVSQARQHLEPARTVVDLHIEKLTDDWKNMSNFEILTFQVNEFEKWYQLAIAHHEPMLTIIHGVGSGRLRDEIHDILKNRHEVKTFINQYHQRYGYGATEIYFQY